MHSSAKMVVYTAIAGQYDQLRIPEFITPDADYVCFTDNPELTSDFWTIRLFTDAEYKFSQGDPVRLARRVKVLPHEYFPDYEYSVWMDANLLPRGDLRRLVAQGLADCDFATWEMPERVLCTYQQAEALIKGNYDDPNVIRAQMKKYKLLGFPEHNAGLDQRGVMSCVLVRRHMKADLMRAMYDWWAEIALHSRRDQLSFHYIAWKNKLPYFLYEGNARDNEYFLWRRHDSRVEKFRRAGKDLSRAITEKAAGRSIYLWGSGSAALQTLDAMPELVIKGFIDNNPTKWGTSFHELPVVEPEPIVLDKKHTFVVISSSYLPQISAQLRSFGFEDWLDFSSGISEQLQGLVNFKDL